MTSSEDGANQNFFFIYLLAKGTHLQICAYVQMTHTKMAQCAIKQKEGYSKRWSKLFTYYLFAIAMGHKGSKLLLEAFFVKYNCMEYS